ncbi:uncharacterized protein LOC116290592 [Actinia tenebrosa]|uniref:Uncharacterized protein LOC116290592 n=1 Tax=Actinia tenebrosa TaxID=6105 RepID=A0A6P8HLH6_ACTTE|nr:uncharacterized protein LOC116290592 [Actinia tenebrosa]
MARATKRKNKDSDKKYYEQNRERKIAQLLQSRGSRKAQPQTRSDTSAKKTKKNRSEGEIVEERRAKLREQTREREKDRRSCLCRKHVETQILFKDCMKYRKSICTNNASAPLHSSLTELVNTTLCKKPEGQIYHNLKCLTRECKECGVNKFVVLPEELSESVQDEVTWKHYTYVGTSKFSSNGQEKKKVTLVIKKTPPKDLFQYFQGLLQEYPYHCFMARWQREQLENLMEHLPLNEVICIHDYSEGYSCRQQDELQSEYFDVNKVSLHITILYRHATGSIDGEPVSTEDDPKIVKDHIFVLSDNNTQDYNAVHRVQELVKNYLVEQLNMKVDKIHEFTDGCSLQYKSRHCIGDLSCCLADFGFQIHRNFFETSHAKGEQDAAGANVKQKVSQAVLRKTAVIRNAKDMTNFLTENFTNPAASTFVSRLKAVGLSRRLFFYVPTEGDQAVQRQRPDRMFKELKGIRKLHSIKTTSRQGRVFVRNCSCYCCSCVDNNGKECANKQWVDDWREVKLERESSAATTRQAASETDTDFEERAFRIADLATKGSTIAIAAEEDPYYDFYLVNEISDGVVELESDLTDDYGFFFPKGSTGLKGNFFLRDNLIDMKYKLNTKKTAFLLSQTVRCVCGELKKKKQNVYKLAIEIHEEIIASL